MSWEGVRVAESSGPSGVDVGVGKLKCAIVRFALTVQKAWRSVGVLLENTFRIEHLIPYQAHEQSMLDHNYRTCNSLNTGTALRFRTIPCSLISSQMAALTPASILAEPFLPLCHALINLELAKCNNKDQTLAMLWVISWSISPCRVFFDHQMMRCLHES